MAQAMWFDVSNWLVLPFVLRALAARGEEEEINGAEGYDEERDHRQNAAQDHDNPGPVTALDDCRFDDRRGFDRIELFRQVGLRFHIRQGGGLLCPDG